MLDLGSSASRRGGSTPSTRTFETRADNTIHFSSLIGWKIRLYQWLYASIIHHFYAQCTTQSTGLKHKHFFLNRSR